MRGDPEAGENRMSNAECRMPNHDRFQGPMVRCSPGPMTFLVVVIALTSVVQARAVDRVVELDGTVIEGSVVSIVKGRVQVKTTKGVDTIELAEILRIERPIPGRTPSPVGVHVELIDGGFIKGSRVQVVDGACIIDTHGEPLRLPLAVIRALHFPVEDSAVRGRQLDEVEAALEVADSLDRLLVNEEGKIISIEGVLQELGLAEGTFLWNDQPHTIAREKINAIIFASNESTPSLIGWCRVLLDDGSTLWAQILNLQTGTLNLEMIGDARLSVSFDRVKALHVRSDRMVFLSDLDPIEVVQESIVTYDMPWQRDRNVLGRPLMLDGGSYEKGVGVHARCQLTFAINGRFDTFAATVGIDDITQGRGDCQFAVLGDGAELFRRRLRAVDSPVPVQVNIRDVQHLTLLVDPGQDLDLADHADWCDARVVRSRK